MQGNGKINAGEVTIVLNDESFILRPTMRAADLISSQLGGFAKARQAIIDETRAAVIFIIRVGTGMSDKDARKLPDKVWENGLDLDLLMPLMEYLAILNNGGRPLSDEERAIYRTVNADATQIEHRNDYDYNQDHHEGNG